MNFPPALNPLRGTRFAWVIPLGWELVQSAAVTLPITLEVFLHHRFGARTGPSLLKGFLLLLMADPFFNLAFPPAIVPLFSGFVFAYAVTAICQWINGRFGAQNEPIHSYKSGEPWPLWQQLPLATSTVQRFIEPAVCFLIAWFVLIFDSPLAHWLFVATAALFIKEQVRGAQLRTHRLDSFDGRVETTNRAPRARAENESFVEARPAPPRRTGNPGHGRNQ